MKKRILVVGILPFVSFLFLGCGGGGGTSGSSAQATLNTGIFVDSRVEGLEYNSKSKSGKTDSNGYFTYKSGEEVSFKLGNITLGKAVSDITDGVITPRDIVDNNVSEVEILRILQSLDEDSDPTNGIKITSTKFIELQNVTKVDLSSEHAPLSDDELRALIKLNPSRHLVTKEEALRHFNDTENNIEIYKTEDKKTQEDSSNSNSDSNNNSGNTSGNTTGNTTGGISSKYTLLAWNDLGMHCFDGKDFSIFSILPPYNNLNAQLINNSATSNKLINKNVILTYESLSYLGHINTNSASKTNFWMYVTSLFPGSTSVPEVGLTGNKVPSNTPQQMSYNTTNKWWEASALPVINYDDNGAKNFYPMVRVVAKDTAGAVLATADVVLPVSDEMDCAKCHASNNKQDKISVAARPISGWEYDSDPLKDYKLNILKLHDEKNTISQADIDAVNAKGYNYQTSLYDTAKSGTPILCATCHSSNALGTAGIGSAKSLTTSLHSRHSSVIDPSNGLSLNNSTNRNACYSCHPGAATQCLRGAMGSATDGSGNQIIQCQSCHGKISDVGNKNRVGWLDEPNCQVCHQNGQRYESALVNGSLRAVVDNRFATNPNTPSVGTSLYRFSTGHGKLQCSSCHGSTHAIFPTSHLQDNIISTQVQGHSGTIAECSTCHTTVPKTTNGGPHGMHTVGQGWISSHKKVAESNPAQCKICHGNNYRGSVLSKTFASRTFSVEHGTKTFAKGHEITCYDCHNGPNGD